MEPVLASPVPSTTGPLSSRNSTRLRVVDDVTSLTSFNPFSEEDENDQSSYTLVTSLFSKVRNTLAAPLSSAVAAASGSPNPITASPSVSSSDVKRPPIANVQHPSTSTVRAADKPPNVLKTVSVKPAPALVSLTPVVSEAPSLLNEHDQPPSRAGSATTPGYEPTEGGLFGTSIPGFPIQDDARSIRTIASVRRSASVSKAIRRIRGEGLSRDYWMDDENCKECYDCRSVFTTWRRKHHCRICGQIFCSRCASNIINGARFGHEGMLRVCNLCLDQVSKVEDDDDDDRRSIVSGVTSAFPAHQFGTESTSLGYGQQPHSPYSASQLFGRGDEPFSLFSIAEAKRAFSTASDDSGFDSRAPSPRQDDLALDNVGIPIRGVPVPFRRGVADEDKEPVSITEPGSASRGQTGPRSKTPVDFPTTVAVKTDGLSSIQFPISSPDTPLEIDGPMSAGSRSRYNSYVELDGQVPFIRSRVQSRLLESVMATEPGWRTRRESTAYAKELNNISMSHLRTMLKQMLTTEAIPHADEWEETLLKLALRIAKEMTFTAFPQRQGEDMDVRRYVKIKKIPGGAPKDSEYVDGAVITKNVAHKRMLSSVHNPRIMLVTFPLEFHRVEGQYMQFSQIVRQEKEYLGNLATRIAATRPHVILVEKSVSRVALDALATHKIVVARSVKPSAIHFVSRMTQSDIISSMDKLLEPHFGHCQRYRTQTFDHPLIPGRRKTYMRFEGCNPNMGCTILLRGGDNETLKKVKKITRLMSFIVRNLKLETHLWKDSVISVPSLPITAVPTPSSQPSDSSDGSSSRFSASSGGTSRHSRYATDHDDDLPEEDAEQMRLSRRIQQSLDPYLKTFISASATLRFPPPHPIRKMKELDDALKRDKQAWEDEIIEREERRIGHLRDSTITPGSFTGSTTSTAVPTAAPTAMPTPLAVSPMGSVPHDAEDIKAMIESLPAPNIPRTPSPGSETLPTLGENDPNYFDRPVSTSTSAPATPGPEAPLQLKSVAEITLESQVGHTKWQHDEQRRIWEWYQRKNKDDFVVEKYQCITLWEGRLPISEYGRRRPCFPPLMKYITFYGDNDCTLGRFIEKSVQDTVVEMLDPKAICAGSGCGQSLATHCTVYVHNETRMFVAVEQWNGQIKGQSNLFASPDMVTTWSLCRVCGSATPFIPVSPEMQRYSFAKFLELHFYPSDVELVQGAGCDHNIYKHHIRYFACRGMTVRFQADPVIIHEIVYPPMRIRVRPETLLALKNSDYERLMNRYLTWYSELIDELQLISIDAAVGDEDADATLNQNINRLITKAESERDEFTRMLNRVYRDSLPSDTLALNQVRANRQDKLVAWQEEFDKLPRPKSMQGGNRRGSTFGTIRTLRTRRSDLNHFFDNHPTSSSVSEAEEGDSVLRRFTGSSMASIESASDVSDVEGPSAPIRTQLQSNADDKHPTTEGVSPRSNIGDLVETDGDSDSTIGAAKVVPVAVQEPSPGPSMETQDLGRPAVVHVSRLPRRTTPHPTVAELVRRYQDYLPPQGVQELSRTALQPPYMVSESEQEYTNKVPRSILRHKNRHHVLPRKSSISDFEQSYAANVAPRYLTQKGKGSASRFLGSISSATESKEPSRRTSPDRRKDGRVDDAEATIRVRRPPSPLGARPSVTLKGKGKAPARTAIKEKPPSRSVTNPGTKSTFRRQPGVPGGKVGHLAKQYEKINKDNERAQRRYSVIRGRRARPVTNARAKVQVLESVKDAINDEESESSASSEADDEEEDEDEGRKKTPPDEGGPIAESPLEMQSSEVITKPDFQTETETQTSNNEEIAPPVSHAPKPVAIEVPVFVPPSPLLASIPGLRQQPSDLDIASASERHSILRALSGFWTQPPIQTKTRLDPDGDDPMEDPEHIFRESSMVVRTDEPTSIIALALNSPQYREMLARSRAEKRIAREPKLTDGGGEAFMPDDRSVAESTSTWGVVNVEASENGNPTEEMRVPSSKLPWQISFESGGLIITCTVLYPEQFDAFRRTYDCEKSMVESLARCVKWDTSGGKSGSAFLKTRDDRFIAKELSRSELQTMTTFAPAYFDYMSSAVTNSRPTILAKVFGCFKITFKKTDNTGSRKAKATQMNLLVMENLFYDRRFSKIYDLKGSTRGRHVQSTGRENEVLLDENLVELSETSPFYLREHSKRILRSALSNDSKFLSDINVMDYSLVAGVDSRNNELVVGIVDYIRTYTWDKKLESWVKDSAFLGGAGRGEPTIITPKQYRQRFLNAMERYFPLVPDRWMKQKDAPTDDQGSVSGMQGDW